MPGIVFEDQTKIAASAPNRMDIALFVGFVRRTPFTAGAPEVVGEPIGDPVTIDGSSTTLQVAIDAVPQSISIPAGSMTRAALLDWINTRLAGGYARGTADQRIAIGGDRGRAVTLTANPALGFAVDASSSVSQPLPTALSGWLTERGWVEGPYARPVDDLLDLPVPIENWQQFEALFDWRDRTGSGNDGAAYFGAAVRSYFAQGGRKCYVVRAGDPWPLDAARQDRLTALAKLIPGHPWGFLPSPADRASWHGVGHLFGLPDVSFLVMPDLADAIATDRTIVEIPKQPPPPPEQFVECTPPAPAPPPDRTVRGVGAPRSNADGFKDWSVALTLVTRALSRFAREAEVVASVPLPEDDLAFQAAPATAFLQLAYPWVRTPGSGALPEQLEPPEGAFTGILARNALVDGTYSSAANFHVADLFDVEPVLDRHEREANRLAERVSLIGRTPMGLRLLSDVTMSLDESYRPGSTSRLIATIVRAARRLGEEVVFDASGPRLWGEIRNRLDAMMRGLYHAGAFQGASPGDAYQVRCDNSTMTRNDLDNGRVVATVQFSAAAPIDTITVVLVLNEGGQSAAIESEAA